MSDKVETIADLRSAPNNANQGTPRGRGVIERSVRARGAGRSGLAAKDGTMIAGSQTLDVMAELGVPVRTIHTTGDEWVVVVRDDLDPDSEEAELLGLEDNRAAELGLSYDPAVLAGMAEDYDLSGLFYLDEMAAILAQDVTLLEAQEDTPVSVDETKPTRCQPGDVWRVGRHTVACLDSTEPGNLDRVVKGAVAMVWADPPYGISIVAADVSVGGGAKYDYPFGGVKGAGFVGGGSAHKARTGRYYIEETQGKGKQHGLGSANGAKPFGSADVRGSVGASNMIPVGLYAPVIGDDSIETAVSASTLCIEQYPNAIHFWWGANNYAHILPPSTCWIVWDKENTGNFADAELAWSNHKSAVRIFKHMWNGLMKDSERGVRRVHPTQKPIALAAWAFEKYGSAGDVILDPFLGSGPSLKAAETMGRTVIGFELSPHYIDHVLEWGEARGLPCALLEA